MKRLIATMLLLGAFGVLWAPMIDPSAIVIEAHPGVNPYLRLFKAISIVETQCDPSALNPREDARGIVQIREIRLRDYNNRTGSRLIHDDCYDPEVARDIFMYYASKYKPYQLETIARKWNGSGPATKRYWRKVQKELNKMK